MPDEMCNGNAVTGITIMCDIAVMPSGEHSLYEAKCMTCKLQQVQIKGK